MNVLVTGGNRGIGLELCRQLQARGERVIATCRKAGGALGSLGVEVIEAVDVRDDAAVASMARRVGERRLDWLINNAGILERDGLDDLDYAAVTRQFEVNAIGPLRVTRALLGNLGRGSRVGIVTSRMGSVGDNTSGAFYGYRMSKAAVNMAGASLARDLAPRGIAVALLHPGYVATDMTGGQGEVAPEHAARGLIARMDGLNPANSGSFWHAEGQELPW